MNSVYVIYTRWKNLKKTSRMVEGEVSYHRPQNVKRMEVEKNKPIVNALNRTKLEKHPDLWQLQKDRERELIDEKKQNRKLQIAQDREKEKKRKLKILKAKEKGIEMDEDINLTIERTRMENLNMCDEDINLTIERTRMEN